MNKSRSGDSSLSRSCLKSSDGVVSFEDNGVVFLGFLNKSVTKKKFKRMSDTFRLYWSSYRCNMGKNRQLLRCGVK